MMIEAHSEVISIGQQVMAQTLSTILLERSGREVPSCLISDFNSFSLRQKITRLSGWSVAIL